MLTKNLTVKPYFLYLTKTLPSHELCPPKKPHANNNDFNTEIPTQHFLLGVSAQMDLPARSVSTI